MNPLKNDEWLNKAVYVVLVKHRNSFIKALHKNEPNLLASMPKIVEEKIDWLNVNLDVSNWENIKVPARWSESGAKEVQEMDGEIWYHTTFEITTQQSNAKNELHFGIIDETDYVYINGKKVGETVRSWGR